MTTPDTAGGKAVLTIGHVAGLIDMVALPLWIGALIQFYHFSPEQAGSTVSLFLLGAFLSSLMLAPRFNRLPRRLSAVAGFAGAAICFVLASRQAQLPASFATLAPLHLCAGLGVGTALSFVHGCMGRSANPHRLFGIAHFALGVFAVLFLGLVPRAIQQHGVATLFLIIGATMALAAIVMACAFPATPNAAGHAGHAAPARIPRAAWCTIGVVMCLTLNQSMVFAFVERIGADRGFGFERVNMALIALGFVNLLPGGLAALLQRKLSPVLVGTCGAAGQATLALLISNSTSYLPYAMAASLFVSMVIFTHVFLFGLLTHFDPSGRAVAATPAMVMVGACLGPVLGGVIVQAIGYPGLGWTACLVATTAVFLMAQAGRHRRASSSHAAIPVIQA